MLDGGDLFWVEATGIERVYEAMDKNDQGDGHGPYPIRVIHSLFSCWLIRLNFCGLLEGVDVRTSLSHKRVIFSLMLLLIIHCHFLIKLSEGLRFPITFYLIIIIYCELI